MNRRRFLILLAIFPPLAIFVAARRTASWRPVAIAKVTDSSVNAASERYLIIGGNEGGPTLFDLKTRTWRYLANNEGITSEGAWKWKTEIVQNKMRLRLREADGPISYYEMPGATFTSTREDMTPSWIRVVPTANRVEVLCKDRYYRWKLGSRQLERNVRLKGGKGFFQAITRDGEAAVRANAHEITIVSTHSEQLMKRVLLMGFQNSGSPTISAFGSYALYNDREQSHFSSWHVVNARTGRTLWTFNTEISKTFSLFPFFSPDETLIALPVPSMGQWQIRDLKTGQILRTLPLLPNAPWGAFSPDGATLYSVANGVLYRQRAR